MTTADSTRSALVDKSYHWRAIDAGTPRGAKIQLIRQADGVAHYGRLSGGDTHWTHWAPLPTFHENFKVQA